MNQAENSLTPRQSDNRFEEFLSGSAKTFLIKSFLDFELGALLASEGPLSSDAIAKRFMLHPRRTAKWLHVLSLLGLAEERHERTAPGSIEVRFALGPLARAFFGEDGKGGPYYRDLLNYQYNISILNVAAVLKWMPLPAAVKWPPQTLEAASHLEWWMSMTAPGAVHAIEKTVDLGQAKRLLDVGGGDGTMACAFAKAHPNLKVAVFNLPNSASLARKKISELGQSENVAVVEGDFLNEQPLPGGFGIVLFSRVLADWPPEVARELLKKAYKAVEPGGQVVICEPLFDDNPDLVIAWEFRYMFYDDFGVGVYKTRAAYEEMLVEAGLKLGPRCPLDEQTFYSVIVGTRPVRAKGTSEARD